MAGVCINCSGLILTVPWAEGHPRPDESMLVCSGGVCWPVCTCEDVDGVR